MNTQTRERYGLLVIESVEGEAMRKEICLCLHCVRLVTVEDVMDIIPFGRKADRIETKERIEELVEAFNCPTARANFLNCVKGGVAAPITRCPFFVDVDLLTGDKR